MQDINQFILPTPVPPSYVLDGADQAPISPGTSRSFSWSLESEPHLFTNDATFWQDVSSFICSSPQTAFDYRSEDLTSATSPTSPSEDANNPKAAEPGEDVPSAPQQPSPVRGQTLELLLKRRAQNRASQRAYRDRRDQHVRDLEAQFEVISKRNAELTRENQELCAAHERLRQEMEAWRVEKEKERLERERMQQQQEEEITQKRIKSAGRGKGSYEGGLLSAEAVAGSYLQEVLGIDTAREWEDHDGERGDEVGAGNESRKGGGGGGGGGGTAGLVVKVVVCKRCFGPAVKTKCEN